VRRPAVANPVLPGLSEFLVPKNIH
jgi:hypothetical protein